MKNIIKSGFDCATPLTAETAKALHNYGYDVAIRYLVPSKYSNHLSKNEAQIITDAQMKIATVYETTGTTPKQGYSQGVIDAKSALACATELNIPIGACIYFAVDYQPISSDDMYNISNYFIGISSIITAYKIGVYGCYDVVEWLHRQNICSCYWQCLAWSFSKISEFANMYQKTSGKIVGGVNIDMDDVFDDVGLWNYDKKLVETVNMIINGKLCPIERILQNNENYVRLRSLADIDNADSLTVDWNNELGTVIINTKEVKL